MKKKLRIKLTKSAIGFAKQQKETLKSLGLNRINQIREITDTPQIQGMLFKVRHLVEVTGEAVSSGAKVASEQVSTKVETLKKMQTQRASNQKKYAPKKSSPEKETNKKATTKGGTAKQATGAKIAKATPKVDK